VRRCLIVLTAAAVWHPVAATALFALLRRRPALVAYATAPMVQLVIDRAPDDIAAAVESVLPRYSAELLWPAAALARRLYDTLPATAAAAHRAHRLENLGLRLSMLGRGEDAVMATTEAVGLYRRLAANNPTDFEPDLAGSLNNLSVTLSDLGLHRDALTASTQAVGIRRRLAAVNRTAFEPGLAMALNNQSVVLSNLGRRHDAVAASTQAVEVYRRMAATNPTAFEPHLARALTNHGADLSDLGRSQDALTVTTEAVDIHRRPAAAHLAAFEPAPRTRIVGFRAGTSRRARGATAGINSRARVGRPLRRVVPTTAAGIHRRPARRTRDRSRGARKSWPWAKDYLLRPATA
jgi:tetratricopeptide (TPR) repeat protein